MPADTAERKIVRYEAVPDPLGGGTWRILHLPVFASVHEGAREDDFTVSGEKLRQYAKQANERAETVGHYRALHLGHQNLKGVENAPLLAFLENFQVEDTTWGPMLFADLWGVDEPVLRQFEAGRFPYVSIEVDDDEILSCAILTSRPPHFPFPNIFVRRSKGDGGAPVDAATASKRQQFARQNKHRFAAMPYDNMMPDDGMKDKKQYADDKDKKDGEKDKKEDVEQMANDDVMASDAPPKPAMPDPVMAKLEEVLQAIKALAGGGMGAKPAAAQMQAGTPATMRPLEPSSNAQYAKLSPEDQKAIAAVQQFAAKQASEGSLRGAMDEARAAGASEDEMKVLEGLHRDSPKAARTFAAHIRTRSKASGGAQTVTAVDAPASTITEVLKQFQRVTQEDRQAAEAALRDWRDTVADQTNNGRSMRIQFGGETGAARWVKLQVEASRRQRNVKSFSA